MWKTLLGKTPIRVWAIKQIDRDLIHLCGEGGIAPGSRRERERTLAALQRGDYRGPVRMASTGLVLNARLFAALVPHDDLQPGTDGQAHWRGRTWRVAQVPQRCWTYEGRLEARSMAQGPLDLVSSEDVSDIRQRATSERPVAPRGAHFGAADELEGEAEFAARWQRDADRPRHQAERLHDDTE